MNRNIFAATLISMAGIATAFEVDFGKSGFTGGIPDGWQEATNLAVGRNISIQNPSLQGGHQALTINLYNATENASKVLFCTTSVENVVCDNISASISTYRKRNLSGKVDKVQVVVSTNDFVTCEPIGQIDLQEIARTADGWVTNTVSTNIVGLSSAENKYNVKIGLKVIGAGVSGKLGYVGWLKADFVASATPRDVCFVSAVEGGTYSTLETLVPGEENARVSAIVPGLPVDKIAMTNVYAVVTRNGVPLDEMQLSRLPGTEQYVSTPITNAFDAGEEVSISIRTEYTVVQSLPPLPTLGHLENGVAKEYANDVWSDFVGKKGSVWINEIKMDHDGLAIEFAGTTNRIMTYGWELSISNVTSEAEPPTRVPISGKLTFTTNLVNDVVGLDVRRFSADVFSSGTNVVRLINSRGICECMVQVVSEGESYAYGVTGISTWNDELGYSYDWTGTGDDVSAEGGVFNWRAIPVDKSNIGEVNYLQGFKVPFSTTILITTTSASGANLPYAAVDVIAEDVTNVVESTETVYSIQTSSNGLATIAFNGHSCSKGSIPVTVSASAFGWYADEITYDVKLSSQVTNELSVPMSCVPAFDDCDSLKVYWNQTNNTKWTVDTTSTRKSLKINLYNARAGITNSVMQCMNPLSAGGNKYVSVSFDFRNAADANMQNYNELCIVLGTNSTWSGETFEAVALSNKRAEYNKNDWYTYNKLVELPAGFEGEDIWLSLICRTFGGASSAFLYVDNLRIAFQDTAIPTNLTRSVESPANGDYITFTLDIIPQTTGAVQEVSADLHLVLNEVTNIVPFAFVDGTLTNAISLVDGEAQAVQMSITADELEAALGGPFMTGDEVTYFAAVRYNSANGAVDPTEVYETRYFPDNATTSNEYWIVEGNYGVGDLSANTFTVTGDALSCIGTPEVTTEGVKFTVHGFNENRISSLTVNLNGADYHPFEGLDTNAQVRVTGEFELASGLAPNTQYTVTITATDANGNPITPGTFTFWTLPEAPTVTIEGISASEVRLIASGNAAGYEVPAGWTKTSANTWTKGGGTPNQMVEATVRALNADGGKSAPTAASGYTLAAAATQAPAIEKGETTVDVAADGDYDEEDDGNPAGTEYAIRVTTSNGGNVIFSTNNVEVWKTLAEWQQNPETVSTPAIDLSATNAFSFVTRNFVGVRSESSVSTNCWFDMIAAFIGGKADQIASPFGTVQIALEFFDPAQSDNATAEVEYRIGEGEWTQAGAFDVSFDDIITTTNLSWDAWTAVGQAQGSYSYGLRARIIAGDRSSEWAEISGTLDFVPPSRPAISGTPANGSINNASSYNLSASASDTSDLTFHWTINGSTSTGASLSGNANVDGDYDVSVYAVDAAGNVSATNYWGWTRDTVKPTVSLSSSTPDPFSAAASPLVVTATFSEDVTGLSAAGLTVVNGTAVVSGSGKVWTITVTPTADGDVSVAVNADAATDAAGNGNTASVTLTRRYDATQPTVSLSSATPDPFNAAASPLVVTATFSEDVTGLSAAGLTVVNGTAVVSGSGKVWTITVTPTADGNVSVTVKADAATDAAGNGNTASATLTRKYDGTAPTVVLSSATPDPFNAAASPLVVTATFSEDVTGLSAAGLTVANGTATISGSGKVWTITVTPSSDGDVSVAVKADAATDAAGNGNTASATLTRKYDATQPTVALTSTTPANFNAAAAPLVVTATFSEDVTGLSVAGLTVVNGTAAVSGSGKVWTITVTPSSDGDVSVAVNADAATDAAGNGNTASAALTRKYDTTQPTVALSSSTPAYFNAAAAPLVVTATFSEDVTGLSAAGLTVANGTAAVSGSGKVWTITVTPSSDGDISVAVNADAATDAAGNGNTASGTLTRKYDATQPTVALSSSTPDPFNAAASPLVVTATFSEDVTGLSVAGLTVVNGTAAVSGSGKVWTITVTPSSDGDVSVAVNADAATDAAGNGNTASTTLTRKYDATQPTVALSSSTPTYFNAAAAPLVVTATFDEDVTGLSVAGLTVVNGTASVSGSGKIWTITATPGADGNVSVTVNADAATDAAGNGNTASAALTRIYDATAPSMPEFTDKPEQFVSEAQYSFTANSTDALSGVSAYYWSVNDGPFTAGGATFAGEVDDEGQYTARVYAVDGAGNVSATNSWTWVYDVTAPTMPEFTAKPARYTNIKGYSLAVETTETVSDISGYYWSINGAAFAVGGATLTGEAAAEGDYTARVYAVDGAGNVSATNSWTWTYDVTAPTVDLSSDTPEYFNLAAAPMKVTVTFSETVTNFTAESVYVTNKLAIQVSPLGVATNIYTVTITPEGDGEVAVQILAGVVADYAGNGNDASTTLTRIYDTTPPRVTLTSATPAPPDSLNVYDMPFAVTVMFSEPVTNFTAESVTVGNGTVHELVNEQNSYTNYTVRIMPANEDVTSISVSIGADAVTDLAGNENNASDVLTRVCDVKRPTIEFKNVSTSQMAATIEFSEIVSELEAGSIAVQNGTVTLTQPTALRYRLTISPDANVGTMTLQIPEDVVADTAGNRNVASQKVIFTKDASGNWSYEYEQPPTSDVEFGGGVCVKVDPETGETNSVSFTAIDFKPGATSTFTMSGFDASTQQIPNFQMWFVVCDTLVGGTPWRVKANGIAPFTPETGTLTVTLPAGALEKNGAACRSFFILGIDNKAE